MRLNIVISCFLLLGTVGCSVPEGQNAVTYLSSVTVQERRIETDARNIDNIIRDSPNGQTDRPALLEAVKKAKETAQTGQEVIEKLHVPESAKTIHELYKEAFSLNLQQITLAEELLNSPQDKKNPEKRQKMLEIKTQIQDVEQKILEEKRRLSKEYQEVQLPEASPSTGSTPPENAESPKPDRV